MSKVLVNTTKAIKSTSTSIVAILGGYYLKNYLNTHPVADTWSVIVFAVVVFIVVSISNISIAKIIDNAQWLRKIIIGKQFIEGYWLQKISDSSLAHHAPIYSVVHISFDGNNYKVSGESFLTNGEFTANFISTTSEYEKYELKYPFKVSSLEFPDDKIYGYSELNFSSNKDITTRYLGRVYSNIRNKPLMVEGIKIASINVVDMKTRRGRKELPVLFR